MNKPAELNLAVAAKPDSQDICFVPDGDYAGLVKKLRPEAIAGGDIVDQSGRVLGQHQGIVGFTIGQRRGLDVGGQAEPLYVVRLDPVGRRVIVGPRSALAVGSIRLSEINLIGAPFDGSLTVKVRSMAKPVSAIRVGDWLHFNAPEYGVSPGQAAVFYAGERVIGGGWIEETIAIEIAEAT